MKLYHVVAMARGRVIGKENKLPWHFPADLKNFKEITSGSTVIMGRKTFESIGRPLPNRENYVLSRNSKKEDQENVSFFTSIEDAISAVGTEKAFIIGGSDIYKQTMDRIDGIYLTRIDAEYQGDAFYPEVPDRFVVCDQKRLNETPTVEVFFYTDQPRVS